MTQKEVTTILYNELPNAGRIELKTVNGVEYYIFNDPIIEKYIVCQLNNDSDSSHSDILSSIEECYTWINSK